MSQFCKETKEYIFFLNAGISLPGMWGMSGNIIKQDAKSWPQAMLQTHMLA